MKINTSKISVSLIASVALGISMVGCGGGTSSNTPSNTTPSVPTTKSTSSYGIITGFGSVFVGGVEYNVTNTNMLKIYPDSNETLKETDFKVGMLVKVKGTKTGIYGDASELLYNDTVSSPITSISLKPDGTGSIIAGGQTVKITSTTMFYGDLAKTKTKVSDLKKNDWIEVSGYPDLNNSVRATMIEYHNSTPNKGAEIDGIISAIDNTNKTFKLNNMAVDYSSATLYPSQTTLKNGSSIEVIGTYSNATLVATAIKVENNLSQDINHDAQNDKQGNYDVELQGVVQDVNNSLSTFSINGVVVNYNANTRFKKMTSASLQKGLFLEDVEGYIDANKKFIATKIKSERYIASSNSNVSGSNINTLLVSEPLKIESKITSIDKKNNTISILGHTAKMNSSTILRDEEHDEHYFSLNTLQAGDYVKAVLFRDTNTTWSVGKLERKNVKSYQSIEGIVTNISPLKISDIVITGLNNLNISVGRKITVEGNYDINNKQFNAQQITYDD